MNSIQSECLKVVELNEREKKLNEDELNEQRIVHKAIKLTGKIIQAVCYHHTRAWVCVCVCVRPSQNFLRRTPMLED